MTPQRAHRVRDQVLARLRELFTRRHYGDVMISLSKAYFGALWGIETIVPEGCRVLSSTGRQGEKLARLLDWLHSAEQSCVGSGRMPAQCTAAGARCPVRIRGVAVNASKDEVLQVAKEALSAGRGDHDHYYSWYVELDGHRVSTKWLVSQLTGLAVSKFVTAEAIRVLDGLGVAVERACPQEEEEMAE